MQIAPSTYYDVKIRPPSNREIRGAQLGPQLEMIFKKNYSVYGKRTLTKAALRQGLEVGRDQVARLMKRQGICGASRAKKRFTTHCDATHLRAPDLVNREFSAIRCDALWVTDFTYCSTWSGVVYVAFIIDVFSRRLVGWKASRSMTADLVVDALNMAAWTRRHTTLENLICHTDAGTQTALVLYTDRIDEIGAAPISSNLPTVTVRHRRGRCHATKKALIELISHATVSLMDENSCFISSLPTSLASITIRPMTHS